MARRSRLRDLDPAERRRDRQPQRGDRCSDPPVRSTPPARVITRDDVLAARATIGDRLRRTPTLTSGQLGAHLKCELFQRTGSFKSRGALNKLSSLTAEEKARGVITIS